MIDEVGSFPNTNKHVLPFVLEVTMNIDKGIFVKFCFSNREFRYFWGVDNWLPALSGVGNEFCVRLFVTVNE